MGELSFTPGYRQLYEKIYGGGGLLHHFYRGTTFNSLCTTLSLTLSLSPSLDMGAAPVPNAPSLSRGNL